MSDDPVIVREQAKAEFDNFTRLMALDFNIDKMDAEDRTAFEKIYERLIAAMMDGSLVIDEHGRPVYTPQRTDGYTSPITFSEPTGADIAQMDKKKIGHDVGKLYAIAGSMTNQSPSLFAKLKGNDYKICIGIINLFLD